MNMPRGFALLSAIFILVVLAMLGAALLHVSSFQQIGAALDMQGTRAYQAARAGIEWSIYKVNATAAYNFSYGTPVGAVGSADPNLRTCPASPTSFVPPAATFAGFTVTVTCATTADANNGPTVFALTSTACNQPDDGACPNTANPGPLYVERRLDVTF